MHSLGPPRDKQAIERAVWLAWALGVAPFVHAWVTAKVVALLAYIVSVALTHDPRGPLAGLTP